MLSSSEAVAAIEENMFATRLFHRWSHAQEAHDGPDLLWVVTDIPTPLFNSVLRANFSDDEADAAIEAAIARCAARNVPMLWWTGPTTRPHDLGERLVAHGFRHDSDNAGMALALELLEEAPVPDGLTISRVCDRETLKIWNDVPKGLDVRYEFYAEQGDAYHHYLGFMRGEPVAISSLFPACGVGGISNIFTVPEARGRGIAPAMTTAALRDARELGYDVAVLQSTRKSTAMYARLGFRDYCTISHYVWST